MSVSVMTSALADHRRALLRYLIVGVASFAVDYGVLALCYRELHAPLWLATTAGFWVSFVVNFALSRLWTFADAAGHPAGQLGRYSVLVAVNYLATLGAVGALHTMGLSIFLAKAVTVAVLTATTFLAYRHWVFSGQGDS